jgi:hypothetical protein
VHLGLGEWGETGRAVGALERLHAAQMQRHALLSGVPLGQALVVKQ